MQGQRPQEQSVAATLFEEAVLLGESVRDPAVCQLRYSTVKAIWCAELYTTDDKQSVDSSPKLFVGAIFILFINVCFLHFTKLSGTRAAGSRAQ
jgi:hypothetical protein